MDLWIYDENFRAKGIVDAASSIIWTNRFRQCGDFEIQVSATDDMIALLLVPVETADRFVMRPDDEMVGVIEHAELKTDEENGDYLLVSGRCARSILERRIVWDQTAINDTVENGLRQLVTDAFISPAIPERKYERLKLAAIHGFTEKLQTQYTGDNILEVFESVCASNNYGFKVTRGNDDNLQLDFYKGVDRSMGQWRTPRVVFSEEYDNLRATAYTMNKQGYKTVALVAGEGEGADRRRRVVNRLVDQSGLRRRELYIDARDVSSNNGEITEDAYNAQLDARGITTLSEAPVVRSMEGQIEPGQMHIYKVDYNLGDIVTTISKHGIRSTTQLLEVVEVWNETGYSCTPTFGAATEAEMLPAICGGVICGEACCGQ